MLKYLKELIEKIKCKCECCCKSKCMLNDDTELDQVP